MKTHHIIKIKLLALVFFTMALTTCSDFLDTPPRLDISSGTFWKNENDAQRGMTACYAVALDEYYYGHNEIVFDCISDDLYRAGDWSDDAAVETLNPKADQEEIFGRLWKLKYEGIKRANDVLRHVPGIEHIDSEVKKQILGQAYFLRAFHYWRLAIVHGGVPVIDENTPSDEYNQPRKSKDDTYAFIIEDLKKAADMLPSVWDNANLGRPNKGAAQGLLAKMYLFQENWQDAANVAEEAMKGPYILNPIYLNNFRIATDPEEVLFALRFIKGEGSPGWALIAYFYPHPFSGWNFFHPEQSLIDEFEYKDGTPGRQIKFNKSDENVPFTYVDNGSPVDWQQEFALRDVRLRATIYPVGEKHMQGGDEVSLGNGNTMTGYCCYKYFEEGKTEGTTNCHYPIIRLADIYLMRAEALIKLNGPNSVSDGLINDLRKRAGLTKMLSNCTMDDLIHERRCELATEGHRHFDLVRWGLAKSIYAQDNGLDGPRNFVVGVHEVMPIPQSEIDMSDGVLIQNNGY